MKSRFKKSWNRKNKTSFSLGLLPVMLLLVIAFGFKNFISSNQYPKKIKIDLPKGDQFQRLLKHKPILHLYAGKPIRNFRGHYYGISPQFQINDKVSNIVDIPIAIHYINNSWLYAFDEENPIRAELRADRAQTMGLINDIKRGLRKINWVHFNYIQSKKQ